MTPQQMRDNLLVLENDGIFYSKFMKCYKTEQVNAYAAREEIRLASLRLKLAASTPAEREEMRLYFEKHYGLKPTSVVDARRSTNLLGELTEPPTPTPTPTTKENTMSKAITVTTQVNVNGVNADNYTDAQLFEMIRYQEAEIKNLMSITNKPQSLLREMETRQAGIVALVNFMNERDAKLNPQPAPVPAPVLQTRPWGCN